MAAGLVLTLATACFAATHHFLVGVACIAVMGALAYGASSEFLGLQLPVLIGCLLCGAAWLRAQAGLGCIAPALESSEMLASPVAMP